MRALILSDIHANLDALEAVLAAAPAHDAVWNLGDIVGYGAYPNEVIQRVRRLGAVFVRGNHDRACCGLLSTAEFNPIAARAVAWTRQELTKEHRDWLRALPQGPVEAAKNVSCMHGSAADEDQYLLSIEDAMEPLAEAKAAIGWFGHTHVQGGFASNGEDWFRLLPHYANTPEAEEYQLDLRTGVRYLLNPGSVGQPRDGDWRAAFAIYDEEQRSANFFRTPYDFRRAQQGIRKAGLPDRLAARLGQGQ